ncbi:MAG: glycosyltransferase family 1 protein [Elusimicrobiota bacterium]|nr:glycosyltransferase family 4 protein [Endomicrobiia bacterium]MDW8166339.1 glycosyltransferase family 1 protein [Elusimicrobiota bacterium]
MIDNLGIGTYIRNLIYWLPKISNNEYILFGESNKLRDFNLPVIESNFPIYSWQEQVFFARIIKKAKLDVFHSPHYNLPIMYPKKIIVTIHDLIHLIFPEYLPSKLAWLYAKFLMKMACKRSQKIIAVSENTKNDILRYFKIDSTKIEIIYEGVEEIFKPSLKKTEMMRKKYGKYILYVGAIRPHKNILCLIEAFYILKKIYKIEHKLILIGKQKIPYIYQVKKKISNCLLENEIVFIENVTQDELVDFYCGAELFVFISLYEGFGLPVVEAMACGCPVIASNISSLPEIVGDAGILVNPYNIDEICRCIYKVLTDRYLQEDMCKKGLQQAKKFSWYLTAKKTLELYEQLM